MKEKTLITISLVLIVVGILVMFFANRLLEPVHVKIGNVGTSREDYVKVIGNVKSVFVSETNTTFLKVEDESGSIDVVIFKNSIKNIDWVKPGLAIEVTGKVDVYRGKSEIIASKIQPVNSGLV